MEFNTGLTASGQLNFKVIDKETGKVLEEEIGPNRILNSGLNMIVKALSNPDALTVGYLQLGGNATDPTAEDGPNGELTTGASEVFPVDYFYPAVGVVLFKCIISNLQGNNGDPTTDKSYVEAVLMGKDPDGNYTWFSRKTFGSKIKNNNLIFEINWEVKISYTSI